MAKLSLTQRSLTPSVSSSIGEFEVIGYYIVTRDRNSSRGGVAMYIRSHIPYTIRKDLLPDNLELIYVEVKKSKPLLITT